MKKSMLIGAIVVFTLAGSIEPRWGVRQSQRADAAVEQAEGAAARVDPDLLQNTAEAAEKAYECYLSSYDAGTAVSSDVYTWSRHWAEAERALAKDKDAERAALKDHRDRMERLFRKVNALYREGVKGGEAERFYAAKFYLAEAEVWLASVQGGQ